MPPHTIGCLSWAGDVVHYDTWMKLIRPDGVYAGQAITDDDVMELQRGGTGFAEHDKEKVQVRVHVHVCRWCMCVCMCVRATVGGRVFLLELQQAGLTLGQDAHVGAVELLRACRVCMHQFHYYPPHKLLQAQAHLLLDHVIGHHSPNMHSFTPF